MFKITSRYQAHPKSAMWSWSFMSYHPISSIIPLETHEICRDSAPPAVRDPYGPYGPCGPHGPCGPWAIGSTLVVGPASWLTWAAKAGVPKNVWKPQNVWKSQTVERCCCCFRTAFWKLQVSGIKRGQRLFKPPTRASLQKKEPMIS